MYTELLQYPDRGRVSDTYCQRRYGICVHYDFGLRSGQSDMTILLFNTLNPQSVR